MPDNKTSKASLTVYPEIYLQCIVTVTAGKGDCPFFKHKSGIVCYFESDNFRCLHPEATRLENKLHNEIYATFKKLQTTITFKETVIDSLTSLETYIGKGLCTCRINNPTSPIQTLVINCPLHGPDPRD